MRRIRIIGIIFFLAVFWAPISADAVSWWPIVPCGINEPPPGGTRLDDSYYQDCNQCTLIKLAVNLIDMTVQAIVPILGTFFFLLGGFFILLGSASPGLIAKGKSIMWSTAIGIAIIYGSYLIANFIIASLASQQVLADAKWSITGVTITCKVSTLQEIVEGTQPGVGGVGTGGGGTQPPPGGGTQPPPGGGTQPPPGGGTPPTTGGTCSGVSCTFNGRPDVLSASPVNPGDNCDASAVNSFDAAIKSGVAQSGISSIGGADTVKLLKAIIANESDGRVDIGSADGQSAGLFQLTPTTAKQYATQCGVPAGTTIDFAWLRNSANVSAQACIAAKFIQSFSGTCTGGVRQLAAGYNGGGGGACGVSSNCGPSAGAGQCTVYPDQTRPTRRWECLWDDNAHQVCNSDRVGPTGQPETLAYTRAYAPKVEYCYNVF